MLIAAEGKHLTDIAAFATSAMAASEHPATAHMARVTRPVMQRQVLGVCGCLHATCSTECIMNVSAAVWFFS